MTYDDDDRAYEALVDRASEEECRNEQALLIMGFSREGGFTRTDYPVYVKGDGIVIFAHHQATNYVYAEGDEAIEAVTCCFKLSHTKRVDSLSGLLRGSWHGE